MTFKSLPFDCARCNPEWPDEKCKGCARWAKHPEQVFGPRTGTSFGFKDSTSEYCSYVPGDINDASKQVGNET